MADYRNKDAKEAQRVAQALSDGYFAATGDKLAPETQERIEAGVRSGLAITGMDGERASKAYNTLAKVLAPFAEKVGKNIASDLEKAVKRAAQRVEDALAEEENRESPEDKEKERDKK